MVIIVITFLLLCLSIALVFCKSSILNYFKVKIQSDFIFTLDNADLWGASPGRLHNAQHVNLTFLHHKSLGPGTSPTFLVPHRLTSESRNQELVEVYWVADIGTKATTNNMMLVDSEIQFTQIFKYEFLTDSRGTPNMDLAGSPAAHSDFEDKTIRTVNLPMASFWHQIKHPIDDQMYTSVFSRMYAELVHEERFLRTFIFELVLVYKHLNNFDKTKANIFASFMLPDDIARRVWSDPQMGLNNHSGLAFWFSIYKSERLPEVPF